MKVLKHVLFIIAFFSLNTIKADNGLKLHTLQNFRSNLGLSEIPNNDKEMVVFSDASGETVGIKFKALLDETFTIHVIDNTGNEVMRQYRFLQEGENNLEIRTQNLNKGNYHLKIDNEYQSVTALMAIKK